METALLNFLRASIALSQAQADLADTSRNLKATSATCDGIAGQVREREALEFTEEGRA